MMLNEALVHLNYQLAAELPRVGAAGSGYPDPLH